MTVRTNSNAPHRYRTTTPTTPASAAWPASLAACGFLLGRRSVADLAVRLVDVGPDDDVVDVGCGPGVAARRAAAAGAASVVGIDPSVEMLRVARLTSACPDGAGGPCASSRARPRRCPAGSVGDGAVVPVDGAPLARPRGRPGRGATRPAPVGTVPRDRAPRHGGCHRDRRATAGPPTRRTIRGALRGGRLPGTRGHRARHRVPRRARRARHRAVTALLSSGGQPGVAADERAHLLDRRRPPPAARRRSRTTRRRPRGTARRSAGGTAR